MTRKQAINKEIDKKISKKEELKKLVDKDKCIKVLQKVMKVCLANNCNYAEVMTIAKAMLNGTIETIKVKQEAK